MRLTITAKICLLGGIGLANLVGVSATGLAGTARTSDGLDQVVDHGSAIHDSVVVDMQHDGIRADLLFALSTTDPAARQEALDAIPERIATMRDLVGSMNGSLHVADRPATDPLVASSAGITPLLDAYWAAATSEVQLAATDPAAAAAGLPAFEDAFHALEEPLEANSQLILDESDTVQADAESSVSATTNRVWLGLGITLVELGLVMFFILRGVRRSIGRLADTAGSLQQGDLRVREDGRRYADDELADVHTELESGVATVRHLLSEIDGEALTLSSAADELAAISTQLTASSSGASTTAGEVSASVGRVSDGIHTVASGTTQIGAHISEISTSTSEACRVADNAVDEATKVNQTVERLAAAGQRVEEIVTVIASIAEQTNLLALNATIEAARAGEAGKGFGVVATEVKGLARETHEATERVTETIAAIQSETTDAIDSLQRISAVISQISSLQTTIAAAVDEQATATHDIERNAEQVALVTADINSVIGRIADDAGQTTAAAGSAQHAATDLARMATNLKVLVGQFQY